MVSFSRFNCIICLSLSIHIRRRISVYSVVYSYIVYTCSRWLGALASPTFDLYLVCRPGSLAATRRLSVWLVYLYFPRASARYIGGHGMAPPASPVREATTHSVEFVCNSLWRVVYAPVVSVRLLHFLLLSVHVSKCYNAFNMHSVSLCSYYVIKV